MTGPGQPLASGTPRSASRAPHLDLESPRSAVLRFTPAGKNCLDKPRFGGPGVKKKACVARACVRAQQQADEESDDQSEEDAASAHGSEPSTVHEISPAILATDGGGVVTSPQHQRPADDDAAPRDCGPPGLLPALVLPAAVLQVPAN